MCSDARLGFRNGACIYIISSHTLFVKKLRIVVSATFLCLLKEIKQKILIKTFISTWAVGSGNRYIQQTKKYSQLGPVMNDL